MASGWSVLRRASGWSLIRRAKVLRPSLRGHWFVRAIWVGTPLARVGRLLRVWSSNEDTTVRVGGPRMGKSAELASRILDAAGAVIATSTRTDLYRICAPLLRGERMLTLLNAAGLTAGLVGWIGLWLLGLPGWPAAGLGLVVVVTVSVLTGPQARTPRPVLVFNPSGTGGLASTVAFNPLVGCTNPKTAGDRAGDLMQGASLGDGRGGEREFWISQARRALAPMIHAAALSGASMRHVQEWLSDPDTHRATVERILRRSPSRALEHDAIQFFNTNTTTRSSITTSAMPALAWLADEVAAEATEAGEGRIELDIEWLLNQRAVVFMIGAEEAQTAPLLTALTAHIAREARRIAALQPGGRLDPPLTGVLDEAALICTPPLERWTADMGGLGFTLHIGVQSFAQLEGKYGRTGAATILNNTGTLLVFGGTRSPEDLNIYATLVGEYEAITPHWDERGDRRGYGTHMRAPLSRAQIAGLSEFHVLIIKNKMLPMIGRIRPVWDRADVKATERAARYATQLDAIEAWEQRRRTQLVGWAQSVGAVLRRRGLAVRDALLARRARREVAARQRRARDRGL
jgi:hypothetical protein